MNLLRLIAKNLRRNLLRTTLTALGTIVLVFVVTLIWSVLHGLDKFTAEKSKNIKLIATERWKIPSQMPYAYAASLSEGAARNPGDVRPTDSMTWTFYLGTTDTQNQTRDNTLFAIAMEPKKIGTMMDELEDLKGAERTALDEAIRRMESDRRGIILGPARLRALKKKIGDTITLYGINYRNIDLELIIVGVLPEGRYAETSLMHRDYINAALDEYPRKNAGKTHPLANKSLNLVWMRVPDRESFQRVADQISSSPLYGNPAVKVETQSAGISSFMEPYRDILWGMKWLLSPAILVTLSLVIANSISISVRERRMEIAVLKVLGFRPWQVMALVLGEAILIGGLSGLACTATTYFVANLAGGIKFPVAFFPAFMIPAAAIWWGLAIGTGTALLGSLGPAKSAGDIRVAEVFSKVA